MKKSSTKGQEKSEAQVKIDNIYNSILNKAQRKYKTIGPLFSEEN